MTHQSLCVRAPEPLPTTLQAVITIRDSQPSLHEVLDAVHRVTGVPYLDLVGPRRKGAAARARMIYYFAAAALTAKSTTQIGRVCGERDHSTICHGLKRVGENQAEFQPELSRVIEAVIARRGGVQ